MMASQVKSCCTPAQHEWQCNGYRHTAARAPNKTLSFEVYALHSLQVAKNKKLLMEDPQNSQTGSVFCSYSPANAGHRMFIQVLPSICGIWVVLCLHCTTAENVKRS